MIYKEGIVCRICIIDEVLTKTSYTQPHHCAREECKFNIFTIVTTSTIGWWYTHHRRSLTKNTRSRGRFSVMRLIMLSRQKHLNYPSSNIMLKIYALVNNTRLSKIWAVGFSLHVSLSCPRDTRLEGKNTLFCLSLVCLGKATVGAVAFWDSVCFPTEPSILYSPGPAPGSCLS